MKNIDIDLSFAKRQFIILIMLQ